MSDDRSTPGASHPAPMAGWYPDPENREHLRYWSGVAWTDHRAPAVDHASAVEPTEPLPLTPPPPGYSDTSPASSWQAGGSRDWWRRPWALITAGVLLGMFLNSMVSGEDGEPEQVAAEPTPTVTATATKTVEVETTVTAEPTPVAEPEPAAAPKTKNAGPNADDSAPGNTGGTFLMPNEVGKNLQIAQDDLQEKSGDPLFVSLSEDATGAGRGQVLDSGWVVCSQDPVPGTRIGLYANVTFFVVRAGETCP